MTVRGDEWIYREPVACVNAQCPKYRAERTIERNIVGDGVLAVSQLVCLYCGATLVPPPVRPRPMPPASQGGGG